jgi:DNA-binding CsgD family transcriptional regulator
MMATGTQSWRPGLVSVLVELGMEDEARRELARVAAEGLEGFRESLWLASLTYLTDACSAVGDERVAALVYPELEPLAGAIVMIGHLVSCFGAADRYLGMLAATLGEWERAEEHFERAADINRRTGSVTWLGHTLYQHGRARPAPLDRVRALGSSVPVAALPDGLSFREVQILALVARGLSNREIGGSLSISEHTAANHVRSILRKTGCANRTQAASYAHRRGLVEA